MFCEMTERWKILFYPLVSTQQRKQDNMKQTYCYGLDKNDGFSSFAHVLWFTHSLSPLPPHPAATSPFPVADESRGQTGSCCTCVRCKVLERNQRGCWQAPCLIYNIFSSIGVSQTAKVKQPLMMQTHKTHTGWEWWERQREDECCLKLLLEAGFSKQRLLERHLGYFCLSLPFICPEGVMLHPAKLHFNISASRGPW